MRRRDYLATAAVLPAAGIAGCGDVLGGQEPGVDEGESQSAESGVALEVRESTLASQITTQGGDVYIPDPGNRFLLADIRSENTGDEIVSLARRGELKLVIGDQQFDPLFLGSEFSFTNDNVAGFTEPLSGDVYETVTDARPNVSSSGLLLFEVSRNVDGARLTWARQFVQEQPLYWALDLDPESVPFFEVLEFNSPADAEYYADFHVEFVVENSGAAGEFVRNLYVERADREYQVSEEIGAGETATVTASIDYPTSGFDRVEELTVEGPFNSTTVRFETPTREVGSEYVGPNGLSITVSDVQQTSRAVVEAPSSFQDETVYQPSGGEQLILVEFVIENGADEVRSTPRNSSVQLQTGSGDTQSLEVLHPGAFTGGESFIEPMRANVLTDTQIQPGETLSGWTLYSLSSNVNLSGSYIKWTRDSILSAGGEPPGLQARWRI